jgi:hypothetical protein
MHHFGKASPDEIAEELPPKKAPHTRKCKRQLLKHVLA